MESAGEAIRDEIFEMLQDGVSALSHGASTNSLELALSEHVATGITRKVNLYRRRAQLTGLCELPDAPAAEATLAQLKNVTKDSEPDWPKGVLGSAGLPTGRPTERGFAADPNGAGRDVRRPMEPSPEMELPNAGIAGSPAAQSYVSLLQKILDKRVVSIETWARDHKLGRSTVFDWKAARLAGGSLKGKVSDPKIAEIEGAINADAEALGLSTRTDSD